MHDGSGIYLSGDFVVDDNVDVKSLTCERKRHGVSRPLLGLFQVFVPVLVEHGLLYVDRSNVGCAFAIGRMNDELAQVPAAQV